MAGPSSGTVWKLGACTVQVLIPILRRGPVKLSSFHGLSALESGLILVRVNELVHVLIVICPWEMIPPDESYKSTLSWPEILASPPGALHVAQKHKGTWNKSPLLSLLHKVNKGHQEVILNIEFDALLSDFGVTSVTGRFL